jgi:hypothetical protein
MAALAGTGATALGFTPGLPHVPVMFFFFRVGLCLLLHLMSLNRGWRLSSCKYCKETY